MAAGGGRGELLKTDEGIGLAFQRRGNGPRSRPRALRRRHRIGGRHPGAPAARPPSGRLRRERDVGLGELPPDGGRVSPAWGGDATSGAEALWGQETMGDMGGMNNPLLAGDGGASWTPRAATACRSVGGSSARRGSGSGHQSTAGTTGIGFGVQVLKEGQV